MAEQLLPCPFCGGKPKKANTYSPVRNVWCSNQPVKCGNRSMYTVDEWNTRPSPWISVSDRLPEESQTVLVCWKAGGFQVNELAWIEYEEADDGSLIGEPQWFDKDSFGSPWQSSPKFWMPIPKCPEVKP